MCIILQPNKQQIRLGRKERPARAPMRPETDDAIDKGGVI